MKIIWSLPTFDNPYTGAEKFFNRLTELLESKGATLIKTYRESREKRSILRKIVINFHNFKILMRQDNQAPIFQNLFNRPEFFLANFFLYVLFRRKIILFIHEVHEVDHLPFAKKWYHSIINYLSFRITSLIVVNSNFTGNWVCRFGDSKNKIFLMYPVVGSLANNSRRREELQKGPVRILCVGNIRKNKGQMHLLQAMEHIQQEFEITFVGLVKEKDYMDKLQEYVHTKGVSDKVRFTGFLSGRQLSEEYKRADIFVLPTLKEGFGVTVLEAMSYGLPVVVSKTGGILEQVTDGQEGFLVPPGDPKAFANKLDKLITDTELRIRMGLLGRELAGKLPTMEQAFEEFYQVLEGFSQNDKDSVYDSKSR